MSKANVAKRFLGTWTLDPKASKFQFDNPPKQATLSLSAEKGGVFMRTEWLDPEGKKGELEHSLRFDKPVLVNGVEVTLLAPDENTLETVMTREGVELARTRRTLLKDGKTLEAVQTGTLDGAQTFTNVSRFRRA
jgi:hypothetical protein